MLVISLTKHCLAIASVHASSGGYHLKVVTTVGRLGRRYRETMLSHFNRVTLFRPSVDHLLIELRTQQRY